MRWFYPIEPRLLYYLVKKRKKKPKHGLFTAQKACCWSEDKIYICKHIFDWSKSILQKVPNELKLVVWKWQNYGPLGWIKTIFTSLKKKKKNICTSSANNKLSITNNYNPNSLTIFKHIFWIVLRSLLWTLEFPVPLGISDWVTTLSIKTQFWISDLVTSFGRSSRSWSWVA